MTYKASLVTRGFDKENLQVILLAARRILNCFLLIFHIFIGQ